MVDDIEKDVRKQGKSFYFERKDLSSLIRIAIKKYHNDLADLLQDRWVDMGKVGSDSINENLDLWFGSEVIEEELNKYMKTHLARHRKIREGSMAKTSYDKITWIVEEWNRNDKTYNEIADEIVKEKESGIASKARAEMIASNELWNAFERGKARTIEEYSIRTGRQVRKFWQTSEDNKVTELCRNNQSAWWIDRKEAFPSWDRIAPRSSHPRCRCTTLYEPQPDPTS